MTFDALNHPVTLSDLTYTYNPNCPVAIDDLILIRFVHLDLEGKDKVGEIVVNRMISNAFIEVMKIAYDLEYPIQQAVLLDNPAIKGNEEYSKEANNTSGFNFQNSSGTDRISKRSYGLAIDLNPVMNPYLSIDDRWIPKRGRTYLNREENKPGMLHESHDITLAFMERGFVWGGFWDRPNYQHFEFSDNSL